MNHEQEPSQTSIVVSNFENESIERDFLNDIQNAYLELRELLPSLPAQLQVEFGTNYDYGSDRVTGSAIGPDAIKIGIDAKAEDRERQHARIRSLVFHEGFHIAQGFHLGGQFSALESAVYEGCATIFEREYTGSTPGWGNYSDVDEATLQRWFTEMQQITAEEYFEPTGETWRKWAFYDPETGEGWRVYKVGTWLVDKILAQEDRDIIDLHSTTATELLARIK